MLPSHTANEEEGGLSSTSLQGSPSCEALASTKRLFFLDIGRMPAASRDSIQFHMVSCCSAIKMNMQHLS